MKVGIGQGSFNTPQHEISKLQLLPVPIRSGGQRWRDKSGAGILYFVHVVGYYVVAISSEKARTW